MGSVQELVGETLYPALCKRSAGVYGFQKNSPPSLKRDQSVPAPTIHQDCRLLRWSQNTGLGTFQSTLNDDGHGSCKANKHLPNHPAEKDRRHLDSSPRANMLGCTASCTAPDRARHPWDMGRGAVHSDTGAALVPGLLSAL